MDRRRGSSSWIVVVDRRRGSSSWIARVLFEHARSARGTESESDVSEIFFEEAGVSFAYAWTIVL